MKMQRCPRGLRGLCRLLGYTSQAYYQYQLGVSKRSLKEDLLIHQVIQHRKLQPRLGARKLLVLLEPFMDAHQTSIGRDVFFELLRVNGLLVRHRRQHRARTTFSNHNLQRYPDRAKGLAINRPEQLWVSDITYINLSKCFAYLSLVTDVYSHKIVGYQLDSSLGTDGCLKALSMAIKDRKTGNALIHHSDRGAQYCSGAYTGLLNEHEIGISMTQSGDPRDNAIAERVNGILKQELLEEVYPNLKQGQQAIVAAIKIYNAHRPHSSIDMLTPEQAHIKTGEIRRRWKSYYKTISKEAGMSE